MQLLYVAVFIFVVWGLFLALPVFAAIVGTGLAGWFLLSCMRNT